MIRTKIIAVCMSFALVFAGSGAVLLATAGSAQAESGASGIVAIHTGSWGYREVVYGKNWTQGIATWGGRYGVYEDIVGDLSDLIGPVAVWEDATVYQAQHAAASNRCLAMVRMAWVPIYFPGIESWGCR
jgi:hypothetical protein